MLKSTFGRRPRLVATFPVKGHAPKVVSVHVKTRPEEFLVGRKLAPATNGLSLPGEAYGISHKHFSIYQEFEGGVFWIKDLGSRWGTFLNGNRLIKPEQINHGDVVTRRLRTTNFGEFRGVEKPTVIFVFDETGEFSELLHSYPAFLGKFHSHFKRHS